MQIIFRVFGQQPRLSDWLRREIPDTVLSGPSALDHVDEYEQEAAYESPGSPVPGGPYQCIADAILRYDIYPQSVITGILNQTPVKTGDVIGICYHYLPGIDFFFCTKVTSCFHEQVDNHWKTGFTYCTLTGHPEAGEATFWVEKNITTGKIVTRIRSWSRPGTWLAKLLRRSIRRWQINGTKAALLHLAGNLPT